jgi:hypothetical protein
MKDREHNDQKFENTKEQSEDTNQWRTENTMAKSLKIPKQ